MAKSSTERWREWSERQKRGEIIVEQHVNHAFVDLMLEAGAIDEGASRSRKKVAAAIMRLAANALDAGLQKQATNRSPSENTNARKA
jgi:hypothetical protein